MPRGSLDPPVDHEGSAPWIAEVLGVARRTVYQLHQEGMPKTGKGKYPLAPCVHWYIQKKLVTEGKDKTLDDQRKELLFEQTLKTRIENEISRRDLVPMSEVQTVFNTAQTMLASQLDAFARRMANELAGIHESTEIESRLFEECREMRRVYSAALAAVADNLENSSGDTKAAAPKKRRAVGRPRKNPAPRKSRAGKVAHK